MSITDACSTALGSRRRRSTGMRRLSLVLEAVRTQVSHVATAQRYLGIAYWRRAEALMRLARNAEALKDWDRALALDDGSNRPMYRLQRALTLARTGDPVRAVAEAEDLTQGDQVSGRISLRRRVHLRTVIRRRDR